MPVSKDDIYRIARLARLELTPQELECLSKDLAQIIAYIDKIQKVDTNGAVPQAPFAKAVSVFREDEIKPSLPKEKALGNAPDNDEDYFRVPKVIGRK